MELIRKGYADTPLGQIHFRRVDGPGVPVVMLHRTPVDSACFDSMLRLLAGRRAAIAFDTPGFGGSFKPYGRPATTDYATWFLAALDNLGVESFHICGHHTGTHFGAEIARMAPPRVRSLLLNGVIYTDPETRAAMRGSIGEAQPVDPEGDYLKANWKVITGLYADYDAQLIHTETVCALTWPEGRNQAFGAILSQDFPAVLAEVRRPVKIVQAIDDGINGFLESLKVDHPQIPIEMIGPAGVASPERQAVAYSNHVLTFAAAHDVFSPLRSAL